MIDVSFHVWCDGEIDGEHCEAEFHHEQLNSLGDGARLERQLASRGWRVRRHPSGRMEALCPLHKPQEAT